MNLLIDIGGTHVRIAANDNFQTIDTVEKFRTPKDLPTLKNSITETIKKLTQNSPIETVCIGIPGIINGQTQTFVSLPNIPVLNGRPFSSILEFQYKQLIVKNDALLATLGEATTGAGKKHNVVVYLTLSTGVGGARISNKIIDPTFNFFEPGHQVINFLGNKYDSCGQSGCLESYVSGTAFEKLYNIKPQDCVDPAIWDEYAKNLAYGLTNVIAMWSPDIIVLGGSVSNQFDKFYQPLLANLQNQKMFQLPQIVKSEYMDKAALYGGLWLIQNS